MPSGVYMIKFGFPMPKSDEKEFMKMGKVKTHKASAKRFSVTANGKVKMFHSSHRHKTGNKSAKRLRHLRSSTMVQGKMAENLKTLVK